MSASTKVFTRSPLTPVLTPPTDNLYKFMAISGLVIAIAGWTLPLLRLSSAEIQVAEANRAIAAAESAEARARWLAMEMSIDSVPDDAARSTYLDATERLSDLVALAHIQQVEAKSLVSELRATWILGRISIALGLAVSIAGFVLWYKRVQKYLDIAIKRSAAAPQQTE
jgi:hypothetical protein